MKARVPRLELARVGVEEVDIGEFVIEGATIGELSVHNMHAGVRSGTIALEDVKLIWELDWSFTWKVGVTLDFGFLGTLDLSWDGSHTFDHEALESPAMSLDLPGIPPMETDIGDLVLDLSTSGLDISPTGGLKLAGMVMEQILTHGVVAPSSEIDIQGLGIGSLVGQEVFVPDAGVEKVEVGAVGGGELPFDVTLDDVGPLDLALDTIEVGGLSSNPVLDPRTYQLDAEILELGLTLEPSITLEIGHLTIDGLTASTSIGKLDLRDVHVPFDVFGVTLSKLDIQKMKIPTFEVR